MSSDKMKKLREAFGSNQRKTDDGNVSGQIVFKAQITTHGKTTKISKKGKRYPALHISYLTYGNRETLKQRHLLITSDEAKLIQRAVSFKPNQWYEVTAEKNKEGYFTWVRIVPITLEEDE